MANRTEEVAFEIGNAIAEKMGLYIVDLEFKTESKEKFLRVYIDKIGGVRIDDCEQFSKAFEEKLDATDPIKENYMLEVSSPGVDRILKKDREFLYYIGKEVDVKLYKAIDDKKEFTGILSAYENHEATIDCAGNEYKIPVSEAVYIRLHFTF